MDKLTNISSHRNILTTLQISTGIYGGCMAVKSYQVWGITILTSLLKVMSATRLLGDSFIISSSW